MKFEGREVAVYDGPKGSFFIKKGYTKCPDIYNIEDYEATKEILKAYAEAGAEYLQTNTFNSNGLALKDRGFYDLQKKIIEESIRCTKEAAEETEPQTGIKCKIVYITGPSGKMIEPYGDITEEEAYFEYKKQTEIAAACGIDAVHYETFMDLNEMRIAVSAGRDVREAYRKETGKDFKIFATMAFESHGRTMFGNSAADCVEVFKEYGVDAYGANCGCTAVQLRPVIEEFVRCADEGTMIIAKPNGGKPIKENDKVIYKETPELFADAMDELIRAGASLVGGCCGTSDEHIRALRATLAE